MSSEIQEKSLSEKVDGQIRKMSRECQARLGDLPSALDPKESFISPEPSSEEVLAKIKKRCEGEHVVYGKRCGNIKDGKCCLDLSGLASENNPIT